MANPPIVLLHIIKRGNKDDYWLDFAVAFPHEGGVGLNLLLHDRPLNGKSVLRTSQ